MNEMLQFNEGLSRWRMLGCSIKIPIQVRLFWKKGIVSLLADWFHWNTPIKWQPFQSGTQREFPTGDTWPDELEKCWFHFEWTRVGVKWIKGEPFGTSWLQPFWLEKLLEKQKIKIFTIKSSAASVVPATFELHGYWTKMGVLGTVGDVLRSAQRKSWNVFQKKNSKTRGWTETNVLEKRTVADRKWNLFRKFFCTWPRGGQ